MKRYKLAILFTSPPFGQATSREGLDALLAASAFCDEEEMLIGFLFDGVFNLIHGQQPEQILQKDHIATFKLIDLYELPHCYVCQDSLAERGLTHHTKNIGNLSLLPREALFQCLNQADKLLTF